MSQTRVDFYLLDVPQPRAKLIVACRLAAKAFANQMKVYLRVDDDAQAQFMDKLLWTFAQNSFLPHCLALGEGNAGQFPIQIGVDSVSPADCRDMLISLSQEASGEFALFQRVAELIGEDENDKLAGRQRFRFYRQQGIEPQTHQIQA